MREREGGRERDGKGGETYRENAAEDVDGDDGVVGGGAVLLETVAAGVDADDDKVDLVGVWCGRGRDALLDVKDKVDLGLLDERAGVADDDAGDFAEVAVDAALAHELAADGEGGLVL